MPDLARRRRASRLAWIPGFLGGSQNHGAGAVAEEHAGAAVVPVEDAREDLGADHQGFFRSLVL
jgi:hypothetical protein